MVTARVTQDGGSAIHTEKTTSYTNREDYICSTSIVLVGSTHRSTTVVCSTQSRYTSTQCDFQDRAFCVGLSAFFRQCKLVCFSVSVLLRPWRISSVIFRQTPQAPSRRRGALIPLAVYTHSKDLFRHVSGDLLKAPSSDRCTRAAR